MNIFMLWLVSMIMSFSLMVFCFSLSPYLLSLNLILFTLMISTLLFLNKLNWFFYTLIIMFLGGMMVIFIYTASMKSLFKFSMVKKNFMFSMVLTFIFFLLFYSYNSTNFWQSKVFYLKSNFFLVTITATILLLTLFIVIKLIQTNKGPLKN